MFKSNLLTDFEHFKAAPVEKRIELVDKICDQFNLIDFKPNEMNIIDDILSALAMDIEVNIRKTVAESLKNNPKIPTALAKRLALDVTEVSAPILEFSEALTDEELKEIIRSTAEIAKLTCIAKRKTVSENVSYALIEKEIDAVILTLMNNDGAKISPKGQELIFNVFNTSTDILDAMVKHSNLSPSLASRLVSYVSDAVSKSLISTYNLSSDIATNASQEAESIYNVDILSHNLSEENAQKLVTKLFHDGKLNHSIVLRSLARGDLTFLYHSIAMLAGITFENTKKLLQGGDEKAFEALFKAANMPTTMYKACYVILQLSYEQRENEFKTEAHYSYLIENIINKKYDKNIPNMRYFLALLNNLRLQSSPQQNP